MRGIRTLASLGSALRAERARRGMTQLELAERAHLSRATVISLEAGGRADITTLLSAAAALDLELHLAPREVRQDAPSAVRSETDFDRHILDGTEEL